MCRGKYESFLKPTCFTNAAMQWGLEHEKKAIELYECVTGTEVAKAGFFVHKSGALGRSPDGVVRAHRKLVEIKCPFSKRHCSNLTTVVDSDSSPFYVKRGVKGDLFLDISHPQGWDYWHQVQGCIYLSEWAESCDFVVWKTQDLLIVNVKRDATWEKQYVGKLL